MIPIYKAIAFCEFYDDIIIASCEFYLWHFFEYLFRLVQTEYGVLKLCSFIGILYCEQYLAFSDIIIPFGEIFYISEACCSICFGCIIAFDGEFPDLRAV